MSQTTITKTIKEINNGIKLDSRVRRSGGGRKYVETNYPGIKNRINEIINGKTYEVQMRPLSYTTYNLRKIKSDIQEELLNVYSRHDMLQIYSIAVLRVCEPGIKDCELKEAYETS